MEDRIAISRIKQGDLNGLESPVNRYQAQAVQAAYLIVRDRPLAEDVAQMIKKETATCKITTSFFSVSLYEFSSPQAGGFYLEIWDLATGL